MPTHSFAEKHPYWFSFLLILVFFLVNAVGIAAAQQMGLPAQTFAVYIQAALVIILTIVTIALRWWSEIGFRWPANPRTLVIFLPGLALFVGNLTFGISSSKLAGWPIFALLALSSGYVEEVTFRGLMLRAFRPRGPWYAVVATAVLFGGTHLMNALAGSNRLYVLVQIGYALAIGFAFAAMALRGKLLWPLVLLHALGNFVAFINSDTPQLTGGEVTTQVWIVSIIYIIWFTIVGWFVLRQKSGESEETLAHQGAGGPA